MLNPASDECIYVLCVWKRGICLGNAHAYLGLAAIAEVGSASGFINGFSSIRSFEVAAFIIIS